MSSAVQVRLTTDTVPAAFKSAGGSFFNGEGFHIVARDDESLFLRAIQQAGRRLDASGAATIEAVGPGWTLERQWALAQGFSDAKKRNKILWCSDDLGVADQLQGMYETFAWARELVNLPPQAIYPESLCTQVVDKIKALGGDAVSFRILREQDLLNEGWMGIHTVGRASMHKPTMLQLDYNPTGDVDAEVDYALIGKGITYDSGGYSIKSSEGMIAMKCDMGGAATVAGALALAIQRGLNKRVKLILCCAENLIDGTAYKLGDIITYKNGVTVEIFNTDAEGRLVLADGLLAAAECNAKHIIDAATLTGAAQVAVGQEYNALFSVDDAYAAKALQAAQSESEPLWRLPLASWHQDQCPSHFADTANSRPVKGGGAGGASNAAGFLLRFAPNQGANWLHFDLAAAYRKDPDKWFNAGATGLGIRTIARTMLDN
ncbi:aminopeptidase PepB [Aliidiomarina maris]|uniref:Aminopeptidase B n=1 Tax=Aliidiomarina maris TaxID=531312 RepID=A0A327WSW2_9GAMM|nr:aminopeptidase PepB [Aliidiomarina maris]RAJ94970.1 aminopeptidase B [Aliidiomarina maris]RUO22199.1 aminopeptidase PepB [Aliidiomarina maris]